MKIFKKIILANLKINNLNKYQNFKTRIEKIEEKIVNSKQYIKNNLINIVESKSKPI